VEDSIVFDDPRLVRCSLIAGSLYSSQNSAHLTSYFRFWTEPVSTSISDNVVGKLSFAFEAQTNGLQRLYIIIFTIHTYTLALRFVQVHFCK
jgi:hypothetical protein